ncbi:tetratricopeptide (TPR) repeat protein [Gordonia hydrophobica]|nr:tetratricopeptide (TPR) repeat protein [Gordonia hydrophobica]
MNSDNNGAGAVQVRADAVEPYFDLGDYGRTVASNNAVAQLWFDRGLVWSYGFNHEEAIACFERAVSADPTCAMAYWGIAYAHGPNYNKPWEAFDETELQTAAARTHEAVLLAVDHAEDGTVEAALAGALLARYPRAQGPNGAEQSVWSVAYAEAMGRVYHAHRDDLDVAALYADALMNLTPWELWDTMTGEPAAGARTLEAKEVLDAALQLPGGTEHPGVLHFYIHLMEMSARPEDALPVADRLRGLVPDAGHLEHMPTHLDILCGDYRRAIESNGDAARADRLFVEREGPLNFYTLYRAHNLHFRIYAAMFAGRLQPALESAADLEEAIPESLLRVTSPPMADWLEGFLTTRLHVYVRFGRWDEILATPLPTDPELYCVSTAIHRYARGVALAVLGQVEAARAEQGAFREAVRRVPETRTLFNNVSGHPRGRRSHARR